MVGFSASLLFCMSQSDRMWNAADRVEDSPRSGEEGGPDSKSGLQWEGGGSRSCLFALWYGSRGGELNGGGSCRVLRGHSLLSSHSQLLGPGWVGGWGLKKKKKKNLPWCTLLKHAGLQVGVEWGQWIGPCEALWCSVAQHEWMSLKKGTAMLSQTSVDKQRLK